MSKKGKLSNSAIAFIGIIIIVIGLFIGSYEYLKSKKDKVFSKMNIMLYENEQPENIVDEEVADESPEVDHGAVSEESQQSEDKKNMQNAQYNPMYDYIGTIEIPKLNLKRGFLDLDSKYNNINYNVTVIQGSTFPDVENNNLILAAHSGNCWYCYFNTLYKLDIGDIAFLTYEGETHTYKIVNIYEVEKTGTVSIYRNYDKKVLTLITCTRNSNTKQTVYILEYDV